MVIAVVVSLGLAALILTVGSPLVAAGVALAMLAFTALDIRELAHQMHEARVCAGAHLTAEGRHSESTPSSSTRSTDGRWDRQVDI